MPIYEYQCNSCDHRLEALQKFSDVPLTECPACHQQALRKLVSAPSFRLKGGGWYETDFKTGNKKGLAGAESDGTSEAGEANAGKSGAEAAGKSKDEKGAASDASARAGDGGGDGKDTQGTKAAKAAKDPKEAGAKSPKKDSKSNKSVSSDS